MDGYALRAADAIENARLRVIGQSLAGHVFEGSLGQGECVRIMTGAVIPPGADSVIMQEQVQLLGDQIQLTKSISTGEKYSPCR
jgi:molybdopterin molybdotransferase